MAVKPSTTVLKALRLLEALKEAGGPITAREAADRTKTDRATAYRLLMTFVEAGYVTHDEETKRFEMGFKLVSLAHSLLQEDQKIESIRDVMRQVSLQSTEACHYSILEGSESVITLRERGKQLVTVDFRGRQPVGSLLHSRGQGDPGLSGYTLSSGLPQARAPPADGPHGGVR